MVEVPDEDRQRRQNCLVIMDRGGDVDPPARYPRGDCHRVPDHQAAQGHHDRSTHAGPVLGLLRVTESTEQAATLSGWHEAQSTAFGAGSCGYPLISTWQLMQSSGP